MEVLGYFFAVCIGIPLGLIGGGGSILTIPLLVYLFNLEQNKLRQGFGWFILIVGTIIVVSESWQFLS